MWGAMFAARRPWPALARPWRWLRVRLGLALLASAPFVAAAQGTVPAHWLRYAEAVAQQMQARLGEGDDAAVARLTGWLREQDAGTVPTLITARVWIDEHGRIARLECDSLGQAGADADLREALARLPVFEPPPGDMPQPLVLRVSLPVREPPQPDAHTGAGP
jgi:hypothetical protein